MMRLSMGHVDTFDPTVTRFARQLGLTGIQFHNPVELAGPGTSWDRDALVGLVRRCREDGLQVDGLENVPLEWFWAIQQGAPERDEQIEAYCTTIRNLGAAGVGVLGYNFLPTYVWRTQMSAAGRGGARVTSFDLDDAIRDGNAASSHRLSARPLATPIDADALRSHHAYFLDAVLGVAEEAGVVLALHPDDPPVEHPLGGAARIFRTPEALIDLAAEVDSPAWGLNLCVGTVSEMGGEAAVLQVVDALAPTGQIASVHFRDVQGTVPSFTECFLGEGNINPARVLRRLHHGGFTGFVIDDHVPALDADPDTWGDISTAAYCSRGRAHAIGYLQGVLNAIAGDPSDDAREG